MAQSNTPDIGTSSAFHAKDTAISTTAWNILGSAPTTIHLISLDNTGGSELVWLNLYDNAAPVVGTTKPVLSLPAKNGKTTTAVFVADALSGVFASALSIACIKTDLMAADAPTAAPTAHIVYV